MKAAFLSSSLIASKGAARPSAAVTQPLELISNNPHHEAKNTTAPAFVPTKTPDLVTKNTNRAMPCGLSDSKCRSDTASASAQSDNLKQDAHGRVRVSLRMTPEQHLKLKLLSAHSRKSVQSLLIEALDKQLADYAAHELKGQCACMNDQNVN